MTPADHGPRAAAQFDVRWIDVWAGFAVAVGATAVLGPLVLYLSGNAWWVSVVSVLAVGAGAAVAGLRAKQIEPLNGALLMALVFATEATIAFVGEVMEWVPEPLPGLPVGDSTIFFVSPLGQLAFAVAGSLFGGWWATRTPASAGADDLAVGSRDDPSGGTDVEERESDDC